MQKRWMVKPSGEPDLIRQLSGALNISPVLGNLLVQRGITTFEEAKIFFRPSLDLLHDPFLMKGMKQAVSRIEKAIASNEKILVYGDYDVDGTTAVALVYSYIKKQYDAVDYYIPDRGKEGYGISIAGIDYAKANGFSLIIALDCGIRSVDKVEYANGLEVDFIICDHHLPGEKIPAAVAVLDPKQEDCPYPYKELSGCGIGFKLVQALAKQKNIPVADLESFLDLTAISIASDIVPITGENRILAWFGLKKLNSDPRPGIKAILKLSNFKKQLTVNDIVFVIGPRINAAGRISDAKKAVELLLAVSEEEASPAGEEVNTHNNTRRDFDKTITEHALKMIDDDAALVKNKTTVVYHPEWHKGVIGIVASRLIEKYYRPTIVFTKSNGYVTGSARSVKHFDVHHAIEQCSDLLVQFGGHKYAAGLTIEEENIPAFQKRFEEVVSSTITDDQLIPEVEIDMAIGLNDINHSLYKVLSQFAPFGPGNMAPVFVSEQVVSKGYVKTVGDGAHLKMHLHHPHAPESSFDAIAFRQSSYLEPVSKKNTMDICYALEDNEWNGVRSLQLVIKDLRFPDLQI